MRFELDKCPCDFDKYIDPLCCAAGMCTREDTDMKRAELGIDGNCGFALLGDDLQSGEAEFVEIALPVEVSADPNRYHKTEWVIAAKIAATAAYKKLKSRLPGDEFSYYLGPSHPDHC